MEAVTMKRIVRLTIMAIAAAVFLYSAAMVLNYCLEMRSAEEFTETLHELVVIQPTAANTEGERPTESTEPVEQAPIAVDFQQLLAQNQDVIAWIYCPDTPINYPIVQASDNNYYLRRRLDGKRHTAGTLFMDSRNEANFSNWNSIIYGHNMKNDTMFGTLTDYQDAAYFEAHPVMYLLTPEQSYRIDILTGFVTSAKDELYNAFYLDEAQKLALLERWQGGAEWDQDARLVTLSTCSYDFDNARYVLIGRLEPI